MKFNEETVADIPKILRMFDEGYMYRAIAKRTFHNVRTIKKVLKVYGRI